MATQLSATPPARHRFFSPESRAMARASLSTTSSVITWIEAARSISRCVRRYSGLRAGAPNSAANFSFVIVRPVQYSK